MIADLEISVDIEGNVVYVLSLFFKDKLKSGTNTDFRVMAT